MCTSKGAGGVVGVNVDEYYGLRLFSMLARGCVWCLKALNTEAVYLLQYMTCLAWISWEQLLSLLGTSKHTAEWEIFNKSPKYKQEEGIWQIFSKK